MLVLRFEKKNQFSLSSIISRNAGGWNDRLFQGHWSLESLRPYPTPLSILVALATDIHPMDITNFPRTKDIGGKLDTRSRREDEREHRSPYPPENPASTAAAPEDTHVANPQQVSFKSASTVHPSTGSYWHPNLDSVTGNWKRCDQAYHLPSMRFVCSSRTCELVLAPGETSVGIIGEHVASGRLWDVFSGIIRIASHSNDTVGYVTPPSADYATDNPFRPSINLHTDPTGLDWASPVRSDYSSVSSSSRSSNVTQSTYPSSLSPSIRGHSQPGRTDANVVFKISRPYTFCDGSSECLQDGEYDPEQAKSAILNETKLYTGKLAVLQGSAIPRFHGLYRDEQRDIFVMVLEDVGHAILDNEKMWDIYARHKYVLFGTSTY